MIFIETPIFTKEVCGLLPDDEYHALQLALVLRPEQGAIIPGSGGLRKLRWGVSGKGKRGGIRVIYYWDKTRKSNNPQGRVPRARPWVNEASPEGRRAKLVVEEVPRACPWVSTYMLPIYPKHKQEDLTPSQLILLSRLVREEFK